MDKNERKEILEKLILSAKCGDEGAISELVEYFNPSIFGVCSKYHIHSHDFNDLKSECIGILIKGIWSYREEAGCFYTYVINGFNNQLKYLLRKSIRENEKIIRVFQGESEAGVSESVDEKIWTAQAIEMAREALEFLDEGDREFIKLHYYKGQTLNDLAKKYGLPYHKVQHMRNRALRKLRKSMVGAEVV